MSLEEEFYILKFPSKLWRLINECQSGAISWGSYGKTILIDYNQFQSEYLECPVPKFKTRNMTSFVRQLNMYGFKKMQTQHRNGITRYCNIHEFFNDNFRFGRPDLLCNVKRRTIPLKMDKVPYVVRQAKKQKLPRSEMSKKFFDETLLNSPQFYGFWALSQPIVNDGGGGDQILKPRYQMRVIPVNNSVFDKASESFTCDLPSLPDFDRLILSDEKELDDPEESDCETGSQAEESFDPRAYEMSIPSISPSQVWVRPPLSEGNVGRIEVKDGFDGTHYIMDVTGEHFGCLQVKAQVGNLPESTLEIKSDERNTTPHLQLAQNSEPYEEATPTSGNEVALHIPESDDFYTSLTNTFTSI